MPLSDPQRGELAAILSSSSFLAAKEEILAITETDISGLPADEATIRMAIEKGVRLCFKHLNNLSRLAPPADRPPERSGTIRHNRTS
jgi:hypothetical protein